MESVLKIYQIRRFITYSPDLCSLPLFPSLLYNRSSSTAAAWDLKAFPNYHAAHLTSQQPTGRCNNSPPYHYFHSIPVHCVRSFCWFRRMAPLELPLSMTSILPAISLISTIIITWYDTAYHVPHCLLKNPFHLHNDEEPLPPIITVWILLLLFSVAKGTRDIWCK